MNNRIIILAFLGLVTSCSNKNSYVLYGKVIDKDNKTPIVNALFDLEYNNEIYMFKSNEKGEYQIEIYWKKYAIGEAINHKRRGNNHPIKTVIRFKNEKKLNTKKIKIIYAGKIKTINNRWRCLFTQLGIDGKRIKKNIKL